MTISDRKKVSPSIFTEMWQNKERILINLIWILWRVSSFCGKCKLSYTIIEFLAGLSRLDSMLVLLTCVNFFRNRCSDILTCWLSSLFATSQLLLNSNFWITLSTRIYSIICWWILWLTWIFWISLLTFGWVRLRWRLRNVFAFGVLSIGIDGLVRNCLRIWIWQIHTLAKACLLVLAIINTTWVDLSRWLQTHIIWPYILGWLTRCTRLSPSTIPLLHISNILVTTWKNSWVLNLLLSKGSQMMRLIINLAPHNLVTGRFISIVDATTEIQRCLSSIMTLTLLR